MKEDDLYSMMRGSQLLSFNWTCAGEPVPLPAVAGCPSVTKREGKGNIYGSYRAETNAKRSSGNPDYVMP